MCERTVAFEQFIWAATCSAGISSTSRNSKRGPFPRRQLRQPSVQLQLSLATQELLFRALPGRVAGFCDFVDVRERKPLVFAKEIDGRVGSDLRQPTGRFLQIFQLAAPLQGLDKSFLSEVLRIIDTAHHAVDQQENTTQMLLNELDLKVRAGLQTLIRYRLERFTHSYMLALGEYPGFGRKTNIRAFHSPTRERRSAFQNVQDCQTIEVVLVYMRSVAVLGIGKTAFGAFPDRDLRSLAVEAVNLAMADAAVPSEKVEAFYLGNFAGPSFVGQNHLAPYVGSALGFLGIPCTRVEDACASGGSAFFHAWMSVASGVYDTVVAAGVEKMTSQTTPRVTEILAGAGDMAGEGRAGATFPALFAMIARRHMYQYGTTREHLASVAVKNHANGAKNPLAHMKKLISLEQALAGKPIAEPLTVFDCSLISDGAAAVVLVPADQAARYHSRFARVLSVAQTSDYVALDRKEDITFFPAVQSAGKKAYEAAGVGPDDIGVAELHDCFTIAEIVASEDLGFVRKRGRRPVCGCRLYRDWRPHSDQYQRRPEIEGTSGRRNWSRPDLRPGSATARRRRRTAGGEQSPGTCTESRRFGRYVRRHDSGGGLMGPETEKLETSGGFERSRCLYGDRRLCTARTVCSRRALPACDCRFALRRADNRADFRQNALRAYLDRRPRHIRKRRRRCSLLSQDHSTGRGTNNRRSASVGLGNAQALSPRRLLVRSYYALGGSVHRMQRFVPAITFLLLATVSGWGQMVAIPAISFGAQTEQAFSSTAQRASREALRCGWPRHQCTQR